MNNYIIREASVEDVDFIYEVEKGSFQTPWSKESFENEINNNKFAYYYVLELEHKIVGYAGMWIILDEAHITNIAIAPYARGKKLGEVLLRYLMDKARFYGAEKMTLEVRSSNYIAQGLYKKLNFKKMGIRKNYYADTVEDAVIMWVNI